MRTDPFSAIKIGSRLTITVPSGQRLDLKTGKRIQEYAERTGKVVLIEPNHWVLNMGGRYGTPGVADRNNIVKIANKRIK